MELVLERKGRVPLYRQITDQIRDQIRSGALRPGDRLPTVRQLAAAYGLTRLTVHSAYSELQGLDLIESRVGRGTFVSEKVQADPAGTSARRSASWASRTALGQLMRQHDGRDAISFAEAMPEPATYPLQDITAAARRALQQRDALDYGPIQGDAGLRSQLSRLLLDRELDVAPDALFVTAGAQQGIDLVLRSLTAGNDVVLVEEPTYPGVLEAAAQQGRRVVGIPRDETGLDMQALEAACRTHRPALLYLIPTFGNPTGTSLPDEQGDALLEMARTHDFLILEDDVYGFLSFDGSPPPPLASKDRDDRVIYLTSLSKVLAPSLRLGMVASSPPQLAAIAGAKQGVDLVCSMLLQRTAAEYLSTDPIPSHLERVRDLYRERRDAVLASLQRHLPGCSWTRPAGGLSLWLTLPEGIDERDVVRDAADEGVVAAPGRVFVTRESRRAHLRLSFGMHSSERIEEGVTVLGQVLERHLAPRDLTVAGRALGPLV